MAVKGRPAAEWQARVTALETSDFVRTILFSGFHGVVLFRDAYADGGVAMRAALGAITGSPALTSSNGDLVFFSLEPLRARVNALAPELLTADAQRRWTALGAVAIGYGKDFSVLEQDATSSWRWSDRQSSINIVNDSADPVFLRLQARIGLGIAQRSTLRVGLDNQVRRFIIPPAGRQLAIDYRVEPGEHRIHFSTNARRLSVAGDARPFFFRLIDPSIETAPDRIPPAVQDLFSAKNVAIRTQPAVADVSGCYPLEAGPGGTWRWCSAEGVLSIVNPGAMRHAALDFSTTAPGSPRYELYLSGAGFKRTIQGGAGKTHVRLNLQLLHGATPVRFASNARQYFAPRDSRRLLLRINDLQLLTAP